MNDKESMTVRKTMKDKSYKWRGIKQAVQDINHLQEENRQCRNALAESSRVYTLLIIDRHGDPEVLVYKKYMPAAKEAMRRAVKYWIRFSFTCDYLDGAFKITCEDVGSMTVREQEVKT